MSYELIPLSDNANKIVNTRYLLPGEQNWKDICQRVSRCVAAGLALYDVPIEEIHSFEQQLYQALLQRDFIFNSPTLFNAGRGVPSDLLYSSVMTLDGYHRIVESMDDKNMLSACFVIPVENSIKGIYKSLSDAAILSKLSGGVGFDFSKLSHQGRPLDSGVGVASGPLSFMEVFDTSAKAVMQGGKRRSAQMGVLRVDHPDIINFIAAKSKGDDSLSFFNISVMITDEFMQAVKEGTGFQLKDPVTHQPLQMIDARGLWENIVYYAWKSGDPGLLFFEHINRDRFVAGEYIDATNPCGEVPLYSYQSCNLGHVNLAHIVKDGRIDLDKLCYLVKLGMQALNLIIDINHYPLPEIAERTKAYRPIGLGVMGFAHLLFLLGIRYGSSMSIDIASQLSRYIAFASIRESIELAKRYGAYPAYQEGDRSILETNYVLKQFMQDSIENKQLVEEYGLRNASWNSLAPTGSVSLICDTSSGIEPVFALEHERVYIDSNGEKKTLIVQDPIYERSQDKNADYFVDAHSISPEEHVRIQAAWQEYISSGVSKTINLPHNATEEDVRKVYELAYELGCKGVTVYRDGCKGEQVLYRKEDKGTTSRPQHQPEQTSKGAARGGVSSGNSTGKATGLHPSERPKTTYGVTSEFSVACGTLYVTLNFDDNGNPIETFLTTGKGGVCRANVEAVSRTVSLALRSGIAKEEIVKQLKGIRCPYCLSKNKKYLSCADALAKFIERCQSPFTGKIAEEDTKINGVLERRLVSDDNDVATCPECGAPIQRAEGCITCVECGYSKCS
ncbi:MAG TPA: adenosylcobalamin-dependent ribonucleoside-diphosphate reductase [Thermodesulfovibrio thiophilus]|nr:adenosylcobalamin-dependent ribonucleoside-diphosphate reductase [Thermodesulfovibrio thiophilus]